MGPKGYQPFPASPSPSQREVHEAGMRNTHGCCGKPWSHAPAAAIAAGEGSSRNITQPFPAIWVIPRTSSSHPCFPQDAGAGPALLPGLRQGDDGSGPSLCRDALHPSGDDTQPSVPLGSKGDNSKAFSLLTLILREGFGYGIPRNEARMGPMLCSKLRERPWVHQDPQQRRFPSPPRYPSLIPGGIPCRRGGSSPGT